MQRLLIFAIILFTSCKREISGTVFRHGDKGNGFVEYFIAEGAHFSDKSENIPFQGNSIIFSVRFDSSAIYNTVDPQNQWDINKLYGFSDCGDQHHINSARFGWNWVNNALHLYAYCYVDSLRIDKDLGVIDIGKEYRCSIVSASNSYIFSLKNEAHTLQRKCESTVSSGYKLFPYFGGDEPSPHDIRIYIREEK